MCVFAIIIYESQAFFLIFMLFSQLLWPVFPFSKSFSSQPFITNVRIVLLTLVFQLLRKLLFSPLLLRKLLFSPLEGKTLVFFTLWFSWLFLKYPSSPDWDYTRRETCRWTWLSLLYEKNIPRFKFPPLPNWRKRGFEPMNFCVRISTLADWATLWHD